MADSKTEAKSLIKEIALALLKSDLMVKGSIEIIKQNNVLCELEIYNRSLTAYFEDESVEEYEIEDFD